ncbi:MAG: hypothetical protein ACYCSN_18275, partial [Acidobacteriaceae bacterium]
LSAPIGAPRARQTLGMTLAQAGDESRRKTPPWADHVGGSQGPLALGSGRNSIRDTASGTANE